MKKYNSLFILICFPILTFLFLLQTPVFSYFSDFLVAEKGADTGSVEVGIHDLKIDGVPFLQDSDEPIMLPLNTSLLIGFTVKNVGKNIIDTITTIEAAFGQALDEAGKLFLYPSNFSDETILGRLNEADYTGSLFGSGALGQTAINTPLGSFDGFCEVVDSSLLYSNSGKMLEYKLFLYADREILDSPIVFHHQRVFLNICVTADIPEKETNWNFSRKCILEFVIELDSQKPVIFKKDLPTVFFIDDVPSINFFDYAFAIDNFDGDITDRIELSFSKEFDSQAAGEYTVFFDVTDLAGNRADTLQISFTIWNIKKIASGNYHTLALTSHGLVYSWGFNYYGQIGNSTDSFSSIPKLVAGLPRIVDIAAGTGISFAISDAGELYAWGRNDEGQLGDGTLTARSEPRVVALPEEIVEVSARFASVGARTASGEVYVWGSGDYGALGTGKSEDSRTPIKLSISNVSRLEMGYYNGAALTNDGRLISWGRNNYGQLGNDALSIGSYNSLPQEVPFFKSEGIRLKDISVGWQHMAAVSEDGRLFTWGYGAEGRLGNGTTSEKRTPQYIELPAKAKAAQAAYFHSAVLLEDGQAYFFGQNAYGKHGNGTTQNSLVPKATQNVGNITSLSLAYDSSFLLVDNRIVYGMGYGNTGIFGNGIDTNSSSVPTPWLRPNVPSE